MSGMDKIEKNGIGKKGRGRSNLTVAGICLGFFVGMVGMAYAAVPLYYVFCRVTGYGGTTQRATQYATKVLDREITVRFDTNTNGVPWDFKPVQREMRVKIGATAEAHFIATNRTDSTTGGRASYNVTPDLTGAYFNKVQCFCFDETILKPGETLDMPVVFYVDPDIVNEAETRDVTTITLSYTFFPAEVKQPEAAQLQPAGAGTTKDNTQAGLGG